MRGNDRDYSKYLQGVQNLDTFSKQDLKKSFIDGGYTLSDASFNLELRKMVTEKYIVREQKNVYSLQTDKLFYRHLYTVEAIEVATWLHNQFENLTFVIFEADQLNTFVNHLIARNVIYVFVEKECVPYIFEVLYERYQRNVLRDPSLDVFSLYFDANTIVVLPLVKQYPVDKMVFWHENLEKFLVDSVAEPTIRTTFSSGEYQRMFKHAFKTFQINIASLRRYAERRHAVEKIQSILDKARVNFRLTANTSDSEITI